MQLSNATTHALLQSSTTFSSTTHDATSSATKAASATSPLSRSSSSVSTHTSASVNSTSAHSSPTIANLILQGLAAQTSPSSQSGWQACQASLVSWSNSRDQAFPTPTTPIAELPSEKTVYKYGVPLSTVSVYTTIDGIPHAHTWPSSKRLTTTITQPAIRITDPPGRPTCTIDKTVCSSLWQSYLSSLGLPTDLGSYTAEPDISPVPSNRPRCSLGQASITCSTVTPECFLSASIVDVFYWPTMTAAPSIATRSIVDGNNTMYSPSVYLKFKTMQAYTDKQGRSHCSTIVPLGADTPNNSNFLDGEDGIDVHAVPEMGVVDQAIVSVPPTELSSLIRDLGPDVNTASVISEIVHGGKSYTKWVNVVRGTGLNLHNPFVSAVKTVPVDFADLHIPGESAYYLNPRGANYCDRVGPHEACGTIYDGGYRAQLALPTQVRNLRPEWARCTRAQFGVYDPPVALQAADNGGVMSAPQSGPNGATVATWTAPLSTPRSSMSDHTQAPTQAQGVTAVPDVAPTAPPQTQPYAFNPLPVHADSKSISSNLPGYAGNSAEQSAAANGQPQKEPEQGPRSSQTGSNTGATTAVSTTTTVSSTKAKSTTAKSKTSPLTVGAFAAAVGANSTVSPVLNPTIPSSSSTVSPVLNPTIPSSSSTNTTNSPSVGPQQSSSTLSQSPKGSLWVLFAILSLAATILV